MGKRLFRSTGRTGRRGRVRELEEEIETHLAMRTEEWMAQGLPQQEARRRAEERFGDMTVARREVYREAWRRDRSLAIRNGISGVWRDVLLAFRGMRARRGHSALVVGVFAFGIALTTTMFTVVDHVLLRSLPFPAPERLVELQSVTEELEAFGQVSMGNWYDWNDESTVMERMAIYRLQDVAVRGALEPTRLPVAEVGGGFFETIRPSIRLGRVFTEAEAQDGLPAVVVSEAYWRTWLGASLDLSRHTVDVGGVRRSVIGVVAHGEAFPIGTDLWMPMPVRPGGGALRNNINFRAVGRLKEGVSWGAARDEFDRIAQGIRQRDPEGVYSWGVGLLPLREAVVGSAANELRLLMGSVSLVMLIVCANLMGLELARGRERLGEVAVRLSLGSSRGRLVRQFATEQVVLALIGGAIGLGIAVYGLDQILSRFGDLIPRADGVAVDLRIAAFSMGLALAAGLLSAVVPAWRISSKRPGAFLAQARQIRGGKALPGAMVVATQVAMTVVLLSGGVLLLRSMTALLQRDLGFDGREVLTLETSLGEARFWSDPQRVSTYWSSLLESLRGVPEVESVAAGSGVPTAWGGSTFLQIPEDPNTDVGARYRVISQDYFRTLSATVLRGREFGPEDTAGSERVVVINQAMAARFWPGEDPIGKRVRASSMEEYWYDGNPPWLRIVGVVADLREYGFEDDLTPTVYAYYSQIPQNALRVTALIRPQPGASPAVLQEALLAAKRVDPSLPIEVGSLDERVSRLMDQRRLLTTTLSLFALTALGLAAMGLYGVLAFAVTSRSREMAVRSALGASRSNVISLVLRGGMTVVFAGMATGLLVVAVSGRYLSDQLVGTSLVDPIAYLVVAVLIGVASAIAALVPTVRASRLDPADALRSS